uniref:E3 ubiquitin-protein ligase CBL n=1 Tax=Panagrolaimus superbus TaxID=310955 RepID=A0A914Y3U3_9BILA
MSGFASTWMNRIHNMVGGQANVASSILEWASTQSGDSSLKVSSVPVVSNQDDRKLLEKTYKQMEAVIRACQQPRLNLKSSPPFILEILPSMSQLLSQIFAKNPDSLQTNEYLKIFINNLLSKCKETHRLFRNIDIFIEDSSSRSALTLQSLVFSHMLHELKSQFPDGEFVGKKFRITKKDASTFWFDYFGDRTIVPWEEFRSEFGKVHKICIGVQTSALLQTIDLTKNNYISNFEFDVFTRLFHPWVTLIQNWECLAVTHPAYMSFITYEEVKRKLQRFTKKPGSYVFRLSCTRLGSWAIGYVAKDHKIYQTIPQNKSLIQSLVDGYKDQFYVYPMGKDINVDLNHMLEKSKSEDRLKVTVEQYQIYCEMGTTFEMCKICDERDKDVKLEPCGHLLCRPCLNSWKESAEGGSTCPWCRCEIKGSEKIIIETYNPIKVNGAAVINSENESEKEDQIGPAPPIPPKRSSNPLPIETYSSPPPTIPLPQPPVIPPRKGVRNGIDDICREVSNLDLTLSQQK